METIREIEKSLEKPKAPQPTDAGAKPAEPVDLAQALLKLPELIATLDKLADAQKSEADLLGTFTQIDMDVQKLTAKADVALTEIHKVKGQLDARLKTVDSLEAKWQLLINRVGNVLDELERVLKHL